MTADELVSWCQKYVGELLGMAPARVNPDAELADFGLDSAAAVSMVLDLEVVLDRELEPSILFQHRDLRGLAAALCGTTQKA